MLMAFTGCSKVDYDLNPWTTVLKKVITKGKTQ
jgi:hypothetical protein